MLKPTTYFVLFFLLVTGCTKFKPIEFLDINGQTMPMRTPKKIGSVCLFITPDCPLSQAYTQPFRLLKDKHLQHFTFFSIVPGKQYSTHEVQHFIDSFHFDLPIGFDPDFMITHAWKATTTPQCIVLDSLMNIQYSGAIDNWAIDFANKRLRPTVFYVDDVLQAMETNRPISIKTTKPVGCLIEYD